jgi:hypothetical protein
MILSQLEQAVWHGPGSDGDVAEPWHHGGVVAAFWKYAVEEFLPAALKTNGGNAAAARVRLIVWCKGMRPPGRA